MLEAVADTVINLADTYGYFAIFVFMFLETSMVFPLIPSEIVVPSTASLLVTNPLAFGLYVLSATAGATTGSLFAYYVFGGTSHVVLERYGEYVRVSDAEIERAQRWFQRWGESSVFWARLLPILRSIISIPAGFAEMPVGKFVAYSASGSLIFTAGVAALVYYIDTREGPLYFLITRVWELLFAYPLVVVISSAVTAAVALVGWWKYGRTQSRYLQSEV